MAHRVHLTMQWVLCAIYAPGVYGLRARNSSLELHCFIHVVMADWPHLMPLYRQRCVCRLLLFKPCTPISSQNSICWHFCSQMETCSWRTSVLHTIAPGHHKDHPTLEIHWSVINTQSYGGIVYACCNRSCDLHFQLGSIRWKTILGNPQISTK